MLPARRCGIPERHSDRLVTEVDLDRDRVVEWRAAADAYLTALRVAEQGWQDAPFRRLPLRARAALLFRRPPLSPRRARAAASRFLDDAYAPHAAWGRKMDAADAHAGLDVQAVGHHSMGATNPAGTLPEGWWARYDARRRRVLSVRHVGSRTDRAAPARRAPAASGGW
ncbi:hypothetical protein [Nonomuraea sp. B19D2]|uniref:hypothetical protein n=1 Tax=Nonomuraea sp. B19D2 TaxID=3159561 RepID=UPI0032DB8CC9